MKNQFDSPRSGKAKVLATAAASLLSANLGAQAMEDFVISEEALPLMAQGADVIHLEVGMPSFDTPAHIKEACKAALDGGLVHYGDFLGNEPFRRALAEKLASRNGIRAAPDEILVTSGLTHGVYITCMAALDPGDEVMLLSPYYPQHVSIASLPGMWERTITHFAFTKAYAMDGWRMGYAVAPRRFIDAMLKISKNDITHVNVFIQ